MASPTRWFRNNSKFLLVLLTIFAMFVFVIGDAITRFQDSGSAGAEKVKNETVATLQNGQKLTQFDLRLFQERHFQTQAFLETLTSRAAEIKKNDYRPLAQMIPPIQGGSSQAFTDEQLIERVILAKKAEKEGVVYSNAMVSDYLELLSGQAGFSDNDLKDLNKVANGGQVPLEAIRRHLRIELLAQQGRAFSFAGYQMFPNATEAAELYQQTMELIECEVLPVDTQQFASLEEKPSAIELKKIYEEGKYDYPDVSGKRPGFKKPNQVAIQYVVANFETFMQNEINKLTDEQVQAEYQTLVDKKDNLVMELIPEDEKKPEAESPTPNSENNDPAPRLDADNTTPAPTTEGGDAANPPVTGSGTPPSAGSDKPPTESDKPATESDKPPTESDKPPTESDKPGSGEGSLIQRDRDFQFASFQEGTESKEGTESNQEVAGSAAAEKPATPETPATPAVTPATPGEPKPQGLEEPAASTSNPAAASPTTPATNPTIPATQPSTPQSGNDDLSLLGDDAQKKRPIPLEKAKDRIKRKLVEKIVADQIDVAMKAFQEDIDSFQFERGSWEMDEKDQRGPEPTIDLAAMAKKYGLQSDETDLLDIENLGESDLGKIAVPVSAPGMQPTLITLAQNIFDTFDQSRPYESKSAMDFRSANRYIYWITKKVDAKMLSLEESEDAVVKFWMQNRIVDLAIKKAQSIADEVNSKKKLLSELYPEQTAKTGEFSWYSTRTRGGYGEPNGVKNPGAEFMQATFALKQNEAGIAVNATRGVVYIVQVVSPRKGATEFGTEFVEQKLLPTKRLPAEVSELMRQSLRETNIDWNQEFHDEMDLKFLGR